MTKKIILFLVIAFFFTSIVFAGAGTEFFQAGNVYYKSGDYKNAAASYNQAAKAEPKNPLYFKAVGICYQKLGNEAMAKKYLNYSQFLSKGSSSASPASDTNSGEKIKASVFGGFTTVAMTKFNAYMDTLVSYVPMGSTISSKSMNSGFFIGAQGGYLVIPGLCLGPRFEYIGGAAAKYAGSGVEMGGTIELTTEFNASIINALVGASYYLPIQGIPLSLSADLYGGFGIAALTNTTVYTMGSFSTSQTSDFSGNAFVMDININGAYKISSVVGLGLTLGYRIANVAEMVTTTDSTGLVGDYPKGTKFIDTNNNVMPFDFSGLIVGVNATFSF